MKHADGCHWWDCGVCTWIEEMDRVTDAQAAALENMRDGLRRWFRE